MTSLEFVMITALAPDMTAAISTFFSNLCKVLLSVVQF